MGMSVRRWTGLGLLFFRGSRTSPTRERGRNELSAPCSRRGLVLLGTLSLAGCASPYHSDRLAAFGGLAGAGVGAMVAGDPLTGAAIGAGVGALSGAVVGSHMDEVEATNRAEIIARTTPVMPAEAVTADSIIAMTQAGISEQVMINHIRGYGVAQPLRSVDLIYLQSNGVSPLVVQAMQSQQYGTAIVRAASPSPPPVIVEEHIVPAPWFPPPPPHWHRPRCGPPPPPHFSWGISVGR